MMKNAFCLMLKLVLQDTHREKAPADKTPVPTESFNILIWVAGISNQLFVRSS